MNADFSPLFPPRQEDGGEEKLFCVPFLKCLVYKFIRRKEWFLYDFPHRQFLFTYLFIIIIMLEG